MVGEGTGGIPGTPAMLCSMVQPQFLLWGMSTQGQSINMRAFGMPVQYLTTSSTASSEHYYTPAQQMGKLGSQRYTTDEYREISGTGWGFNPQSQHSSSEFCPSSCVALGKLLHLSVPQHP